MREDWPWWFMETGMTTHFQELTGIHLKEDFLKNVDQKGKRLLNYMKTIAANKNKKLCQATAKLEFIRGEHTGSSADVIEMVLLLLAYFDEKEEVMFCYVDETCLAEDVEFAEVALTPTIVVCGQSSFSARRMMLSIDQVIVNDQMTTFIQSLCMMFGSYYSYNIHYPSKLASTLEFLQRCFFSINPDKGSKVEKTSTAHMQVNPRVLTLIPDLADYEWRDV
ncbi:uncharacterized protein LOC127654442 [Xyrauchen texanus]|uniref:uncharacterized protein LOC127654442 n=1 Tax=Xyrauchen texanus TaxID=154827 RepID=UPI0022429FD5|nr:uncharacterized protein LOC127654442 [Xyrauchen texanus]